MMPDVSMRHNSMHHHFHLRVRLRSTARALRHLLVFTRTSVSGPTCDAVASCTIRTYPCSALSFTYRVRFPLASGCSKHVIGRALSLSASFDPHGYRGLLLDRSFVCSLQLPSIQRPSVSSESSRQSSSSVYARSKPACHLQGAVDARRAKR